MKKYLVKKTEKWEDGYVHIAIMNRSFWDPEEWEGRTEEEQKAFAAKHGWDSPEDPDIIGILNGEYNHAFAEMYGIETSYEILCYEV